jgi:hypothetical protein
MLYIFFRFFCDFFCSGHFYLYIYARRGRGSWRLEVAQLGGAFLGWIVRGVQRSGAGGWVLGGDPRRLLEAGGGAHRSGAGRLTSTWADVCRASDVRRAADVCRCAGPRTCASVQGLGRVQANVQRCVSLFASTFAGVWQLVSQMCECARPPSCADVWSASGCAEFAPNVGISPHRCHLNHESVRIDQ